MKKEMIIAFWMKLINIMDQFSSLKIFVNLIFTGILFDFLLRY